MSELDVTRWWLIFEVGLEYALYVWRGRDHNAAILLRMVPVALLLHSVASLKSTSILLQVILHRRGFL